MRYLVTARVRPQKLPALLAAIEDGSLGRGSVAEGEYLRDMDQARRLADGRVRWVEVCYCATPLEEERPYWGEYFTLERVQDAHSRSQCRDLTGEEPWACSTCDCTERLESRMKTWGDRFLDTAGVKAGTGSERLTPGAAPGSAAVARCLSPPAPKRSPGAERAGS